MNRDNQPTFNVNRKIKNFKDFGKNKETLKKDKLQTKPNSDDQQQHIGNYRNEFDPITRKVTQLTPDEIEDKLDNMDDTNEGLLSKSDRVSKREKDICLKVFEKYRFETEFYDSEISFIDWIKK